MSVQEAQNWLNKITNSEEQEFVNMVVNKIVDAIKER